MLLPADLRDWVPEDDLVHFVGVERSATPGYAKGVIGLSPGWSGAEPWVLN